jgi:small subunit ribosomal protein S9
MEENTFYSTGKRKTAIARIWLKPGSGVITVNGQQADEYFDTAVAQTLLREPLVYTDALASYDIKATVKGGGHNGQAGAVRHSISKALALIKPELRETLKNGGFLTRDARCKERKKYGKRGARASYQYSKR